jgi:hypothetical protein
MSRGAACPAEPPTQADQTQTRLHSELPHNDPAIELPARACSTDMQKRLASCMIRARIKAQLAELGGMAIGGSPAEFGKFIADETEKWGKVITFAGIRAE